MATNETIKQINSGGTLRDVEDVGARQLIADLQTALNAITSGDTTTAIKTFNEIIAFLDNIEDTSTLQGIIAGLNTAIAAKYTKPDTGIPASDLAQSVIDVLNAVAGKVNAVEGKGLSTEDFTTALKEKLEGLSNYDDTALQTAVSTLQTALADVYTKDETEEKIAEAVEGLGGGSVESVTVNGTKHTPDANGDVDLGLLKGEKGDQGDTLLVDGEFNPVTDIVNDTTTGGANKAWSAEQGKLMSNRSNLAAQRISLLRQLLEHAVYDGDVTDIFDALEALDAAVESITLSQSSLTFSGSTTPGATQTLVATTDPAGANVSWSSSDSSVATVNGGVVTAVGNGTCVITASAGGLTATCNVSVSGILAVYEISLGTLSHVSVADGNGDEIADGDEITEGSTLTIVLTPDASHVIDTASVTMGGVAQTLTDGQDGEKTLTIASVSGDIVISASASYQAKDYADDAITMANYGVNPSEGAVGTNNSIKSLIIPLDFGKVYHMTGYDWSANNGAPNGYNFALVKSDGNGGYTNIKTADVAKPADMVADEMGYASDGNVWLLTAKNPTSKGKDWFVFAVLPQSAYQDVEQVYLCINVKWTTGYEVENLHIKELLPAEYLDMMYFKMSYLNSGRIEFNGYQNPSTGSGEQSICRIFPVDFGKSYSYSGFNHTGGTSGVYRMGLVACVNGVLRSLTKAEVSNADSLFNGTTYVSTSGDAAQSGSFSTPSQADISVNVDRLFFAANTKWAGDSITMTDFILTENS